MSVVILKCPECQSAKIECLNPELKKTSAMPTVKVKGKCDDCGHEFEYRTVTERGRSRLI